MLFPGSGLFKNPGAWIVAAEMVETSRLFRPQGGRAWTSAWLEPLGGDAVPVELVRSPLGARPRGGGGPGAGVPVRPAHRPATGAWRLAASIPTAGRGHLRALRPGGAGDVKQPLGFHASTMPPWWRRCAAWKTAFGGGISWWTTRCWWRFTRERLSNGVFDMRALKHRIRQEGRRPVPAAGSGDAGSLCCRSN
jgi:hypothetical protein